MIKIILEIGKYVFRLIKMTKKGEDFLSLKRINQLRDFLATFLTYCENEYIKSHPDIINTLERAKLTNGKKGYSKEFLLNIKSIVLQYIDAYFHPKVKSKHSNYQELSSMQNV